MDEASSKSPRSLALDDLIMGTNSSSIVSKRSVERLYYPNEPHYFRYFVKKLQRRAPLINRGYWLRLRAIDVIVHQFLARHPSKKALVINLGCGSDVLPWQCHTRYAHLCDDALFVDIDYPDLMRRKRSMVLETPQLRDLLGTNFATSQSDEDNVLLRSERYCQIGCDLRDLDKLRELLESLAAVADSPVLFVAEVSVTYMDTSSADALINWASTVGKAEFCLLEQIIPHGPDHPFAQTMLSHFNKLKTPPKSVYTYPTVLSQYERFMGRGWSQANVRDLWEVWSSDDFVTSSERAKLDGVEPFDEWEEFMLFARHYFVIHASAVKHDTEILHPGPTRRESKAEVTVKASLSKQQTGGPRRRFGDVLKLTNASGGNFLLHAFGSNSTGRSDSCDLYALGDRSDIPSLPVNGPTPRMCYTLTDMGDFGVLLVGGRNSPTNPLSDCWVFERGSSCSWRSDQSLPVPLFRHAAVRLRKSSLVLVTGGKTGPCDVSCAHYLFHAGKGWTECKTLGAGPIPNFGAFLCNSSAKSSSPGIFTGLLAGGMRQDGMLMKETYAWCLDTNTSPPTIRFQQCPVGLDASHSLSLFGAKAVELQSRTFVCGGTGLDREAMGQTIFEIDVHGTENYDISRLQFGDTEQMPFIIGSAVSGIGDSLVVVGGGATCFSMGTYWETGVYKVTIPSGCLNTMQETYSKYDSNIVQLLESPRIVGNFKNNKMESRPLRGKPTISAVPRLRLTNPAQFESILKKGVPVILEGLYLGECTQSWTPQHMVNAVGKTKKVIVHECPDDLDRMDFNSKNFRYVNEEFGKVVSRASAGDRLYLRALSSEKPTEKPANIDEDFPNLAKDFRLPVELDLVKQNLFSSVLRVSGRINMWLHYDVMANVYAQIAGSKHMYLFPPSDVTQLSFAPGSSSSSIDVFSAMDSPQLSSTHPHEAIILAGDVLFLPPLWLHAAKPTTDMSVAVNVFFKNLEGGYAAGKDVYGNRDLAAYEKGRQDVAKVGRSFQHLPVESRRFYLSRLAEELELTAEGTS